MEKEKKWHSEAENETFLELWQYLVLRPPEAPSNKRHQKGNWSRKNLCFQSPGINQTITASFKNVNFFFSLQKVNIGF